MANKERGEVELVARGKTYTLVLTTNGACELEAASGRDVDEIVKGALKYRLVDMRWLVWATLQEYHGEEIVTPQDAGRFIDDAGRLAKVWAALNAFSLANVDTSTDRKTGGGRTQAGPRKAQAATSGSSSTSLLAASA